MTNNTVLQAQNIVKYFPKKEVLKGISFVVNEGECTALIGPNGTGKTVLMSCLLGDFPLTSGKASLLGAVPGSKTAKGHIGVLPQENTVEKRIKVKELIAFQMALYRDHLSLSEIDAILRFSEQEKEQFAEKLSGGKRRFLNFVLLLIGKPKIIFLDEPTTGMDTETRLYFWEVVANLKKEGLTIFYSSHYIEEVEQMADRILVLHQGYLVRDTTPYLMKAENKEKVFTLPIAYKDLFTVENLADLVIKKDQFSFVTQDVQATWNILMAANCPVEDIEMANRSLLDRIFMNEEEK